MHVAILYCICLYLFLKSKENCKLHCTCGSLVNDKSKGSIVITSQLLGLKKDLKVSLNSHVIVISKGGTMDTIVKLAF